MAVNHGLGGFVNTSSKILGQNGFKSVTGTATTDIQGCYCIYFYETTAINSLSGEAISNMSGETFPAGTYLFGTFTEIDLTSGACICYGVDGS